MGRKAGDDKEASLAKSGTFNARAHKVKDEQFKDEAFFDARDLLQVKYEMLRRVDHDSWSVSAASAAYGFSRPSFYETKRVFDADGLAGLLPKTRGPKTPHKLTDEVLDYVDSLEGDSRDANEIATLIKKRFGLDVHPRSIARAASARRKKKSGKAAKPNASK